MLDGPKFNEDLKRAYAQALIPEKIKSCRVLLTLTVLLNTAFCLLDPYAIPSAVAEVWQIRVIMNLVILGCLACTWHPQFARYYSTLTVTALASLGFGINCMIAIASTPDVAADTYYGGLLLIIFGLFTLTYLNLWVSLLIAAAFLVQYTWTAVYLHDYLAPVKQLTLLTNVFFFVATTLIGIVAMGIRDRFAKETFLLRQSLQKDIELQAERTKVVARMATRDSLTDLLNRAGFQQSFEQLCREGGQPVNLYFIDLDQFKPINDVHGHAAGDRVLQELSLRICGMLPQDAIAGRLGGDEFVVAAPAAYVNLADRIHAVIEQPLRLRGGEVSLSCSIGQANCPEQANNLEALLQIADADMYQHKRSRTAYRRLAPV